MCPQSNPLATATTMLLLRTCQVNKAPAALNQRREFILHSAHDMTSDELTAFEHISGTGSPIRRRGPCAQNADLCSWAVVAVCLHHAKAFHHSHSAAHAPEDGVLAIQPGSGCKRDEELNQGEQGVSSLARTLYKSWFSKHLTAVGVRSRISHTENACPCVF
jgi:hypothetical protein